MGNKSVILQRPVFHLARNLGGVQNLENKDELAGKTEDLTLQAQTVAGYHSTFLKYLLGNTKPWGSASTSLLWFSRGKAAGASEICQGGRGGLCVQEEGGVLHPGHHIPAPPLPAEGRQHRLRAQGRGCAPHRGQQGANEILSGLPGRGDWGEDPGQCYAQGEPLFPLCLGRARAAPQHCWHVLTGMWPGALARQKNDSSCSTCPELLS